MRYSRERKRKSYQMEQIIELANKKKSRLIKRAEAHYRNNVKNAVQYIMENIKDKNLLLVTGPSSSGKTTTSNLIMKALEKRGIPALVVSMDNFFIHRKDTPLLPDGTRDYDNVTSVNIDLFKEKMNDLLEKGKAELPIFDFKTGIREDDAFCGIAPEGAIIIVEGLHSFNHLCISKVMQEKAIKVYVEPQSEFEFRNGKRIIPTELRFRRRAIRDYYNRGYSIAETEKNWVNVRAGEEKFVLPYRQDADFLIDSVYMYEPLLYQKELKKIAETDKDALKYLSLKIPSTKLNKKDIPSDALIWEFLGK